MSDISLNYSSCSCHHTLQCPPFYQCSLPFHVAPFRNGISHQGPLCSELARLPSLPDPPLALVTPNRGPRFLSGCWVLLLTPASREISEQAAAVRCKAKVRLPFGDQWLGPCTLTLALTLRPDLPEESPSSLTLPTATWDHRPPPLHARTSPSHRHTLGRCGRLAGIASPRQSEQVTPPTFAPQAQQL